MKKIMLICVLVMTASCASFRSEKEYVRYIKKLKDDGHLSGASYEMFKFEKKYPESKYLCEFSKYQLELALSKSPRIGIENMKSRKEKYCKEKK